MESIITYGIVYLLIFRLAVLLLGGVSIFCGYRLFLILRQEGEGAAAEQGGELMIRSGDSRLTLRSAAPGIFFSAFGTLIVIVVLAGKQPSVVYDERRPGPQTKTTGQQKTITLRNPPPSSSPPPDAGAAGYNRAFDSVEEVITELRTTVSRVPDNPDYHDLLARLLFAWGEATKAVEEQQQAVRLVDEARRADFRARLKIYEQAAR